MIMKTIKLLLLFVGLFFLLYSNSEGYAQSKDWGVLVNNKEWYYEGGRIFRDTKEQCERKCAELNYHPPTTNTFNVSNVGEYLIHQTPENLRGSALPSQSMMDNLGNTLEEERRKVEKNVYTPAKIISDINGNAKTGNNTVVAAGQIAWQNAQSNNEIATATINGYSQFYKNNEGIKGTPPQEYKPRPISEVLQDETPSSCSKLMSAKEYEQLTDEYLLSPYLFREKYTSLCKQHGCDETDDDYQIFAKELKSVIEKRLEEMDEELDR